MPTVNVNGINLYYEDEGQGEIIVLVPGLGGNNLLWYKQRKYLKDYYRLISIDNRGAGNSDKPEGLYTMETFAKDIYELLNQLNIKEKINLIGASMGGIISQAFIHDYPEKVEKLVLVCTGVAGGDPHYTPMPQEVAQKLMHPGETQEDKINVIIDHFYHPDFIKKNPDVKQKYLERKVESQPPHAYKAQLTACMDNRPYYKWLTDIKCPVLIMHGKDDNVWKVQNAYTLKKGIGENAELYVMQDAAHMFFQEKPDEFNEKLHNFLKNN